MFGFSYYLLLPLARGTNGNGYSSSVLLPTPLASDTGDVGKGLDIQISANGSYRKMNKDGKAALNLYLVDAQRQAGHKALFLLVVQPDKRAVILLCHTCGLEHIRTC